MKYFWVNFRRKRFFLLNYFLLQTAGVLLLIVFASLAKVSDTFVFHPLLLLLMPCAVVLGIKLPSLMHNAVHGNLRWANLVIGELTSQFILMGFGIVCVNHTIHHAHPDTELDPHNPAGKSFFRYLFTCLHSGAGVVRQEYLKNHGHGALEKSIFAASAILHFGGFPLRLFAWFCLLGPELFLFLYLPAFAVFYTTFAHVNYVTHSVDAEGKPAILNVETNAWHRFVNFVGDGIYFHKNHHMNPKLGNPKYLKANLPCKNIGRNLGRTASIF